MTALMEGVKDVFDVGLLQVFDAIELELLICGLQDISVSDWKANTLYNADYSATHPVVINFWKVRYRPPVLDFYL